jgi:GNAT superfamily N-acetyltransferase
MELQKENIRNSYAVKITAQENGQEVGRVWLYILYNDLHKEPYGWLEDVFVDESERGNGLGTELVQSAIGEARKIGCYKVICASRFSREQIHVWYEKIGFKKHGVEFRMDLI